MHIVITENMVFGVKEGPNQTELSGKKLARKISTEKISSKCTCTLCFSEQTKRGAAERGGVRSKLEWLSIWKLATSTAKVLSWLLYLLCKVYLCKKMWFKSVLPGRKKILILQKKFEGKKTTCIYLDLKGFTFMWLELDMCIFCPQSHSLDLI